MKIVYSLPAAVVFAISGLASSAAEKPEATVQKTPVNPTAEMRGGHKASDLIGMEVKNLKNERLGRVDDLVVDISSARAPYVILTIGGLLGLAETRVAVPVRQFTFTSTETDKYLILDANREKLQNAPRFAKNQAIDTKWMAEVDTFYGVKTESGGGTSKEINAAGSTVTPAGGEVTRAKSDELANRVRSAIAADTTTVPPVRKIMVTADGTVIQLTGDVRSREERQHVEAVAKKVSGVTKVENKLQVRK